MTAFWLELNQPVELIEKIFVEDYQMHKRLAQPWEVHTEVIVDRGRWGNFRYAQSTLKMEN